MDKLFHFYMDDGHGWVAVKKELLKELKIENSISAYSYMKGDTAYLEEDSDASKFHKAFGQKFMVDPEYLNHTFDGRSPIRSYKSYKSDRTEVLEKIADYITIVKEINKAG